jgi:outer membrane protein TolC
MKNSLLILLSFYLLPLKGNAQLVDDTASFVIETLFELAWENYPQNKVKELQAVKAHYHLNHTKLSWTKDVVAQFNLNEANIDPSSTAGVNIFYPKYVVGLRLNLGTFVLTPLEAKQAKQDLNIAVQEIDLQKTLIKNEVAKRVHAYRLSKMLLKVRTQANEESSTMMNIVKQKFQRNEIGFEEYNKANIENLKLLEGKLNIESAYYVAKTDLETLIGVKLETVKLPAGF